MSDLKQKNTPLSLADFKSMGISIVVQEGGMILLQDNSNNFNGNISVNAPHGAVNFGSGSSTTTNNMQVIEELTADFIEQLRKESVDNKDEIMVAINGLVEGFKAEKPNGNNVQSMFSKIKDYLTAGSATATLINAFSNWYGSMKLAAVSFGIILP